MGIPAPRSVFAGVVVAAGLGLVAPAAYADAGTPLLWATSFHLLLGNAILGVVEGALLARFFKAPRRRSIGIMVAANYLSSWGGLLMLLHAGSLLPPTIHNIGYLYVFTLVALPLATLALEYPCIVMALQCRPPQLWTAFKANLLLQGVTYALLMPFLALHLASLSGFLELGKDPSLAFTDNPDAVVYFVPRDGENSVVRVRLGDKKVEKIADADGKIDLLVSRKNEEAGQWDLRRKTGADDAAAEAPVLADFAPYAAESNSYAPREANVFGPWAQDLRAPNDRDWDVVTHGPPWAPFRAYHHRAGESLIFGLEFPWSLGRFSHATALPHDEVVFQWGNNICLLDLREHTLGLIALGHSPVVGLPAPPVLEQASAAP